jgi:hypothetical protein
MGITLHPYQYVYLAAPGLLHAPGVLVAARAISEARQPQASLSPAGWIIGKLNFAWIYQRYRNVPRRVHILRMQRQDLNVRKRQEVSEEEDDQDD